MYFPFLLNWTSPLPILGLSAGIFHVYFHFKKYFCKQTEEPDRTLRFAASGPVLHCLLMSHTKDARLKWVNSFINLILIVMVKIN